MMNARLAFTVVGLGVMGALGVPATSCASFGDACLMTCAVANCGAQGVCPFYRPAGWCGANASGDEVVAFGEVTATDQAPPPRLIDPVAISRDAWALFGGATTLRAFSIARDDDGRIQLPCTPGRDAPIHELAWPDTRETDPPAWDPPKRDAPHVTSCERRAGAWSYRVVRHEQRVTDGSVVVRYFTVTEID